MAMFKVAGNSSKTGASESNSVFVAGHVVKRGTTLDVDDSDESIKALIKAGRLIAVAPASATVPSRRSASSA